MIVVMALIQPLTHLLIRYAPPEGTLPTGLDIPDSALFLESMAMFPSGFASPYATCQAVAGDQSIAYYNVPHLWLYGLIGLIHNLIPMDRFVFYGMVNGLGAFLYLVVVYRFLRERVPVIANRAFLLFCLSAGPGGLLYGVFALLGLQHHPEFENWFFRFAVYDLMEGPHFNPVLYFPRLYYTLSLAACLGGLGALIRRYDTAQQRFPWAAALGLFFGTFINARYGVFLGGVLVLYLMCQRKPDYRAAARSLGHYAVPAGTAFFLATLLGRLNPAVIDNVLNVADMAMWFSPFVLVTAVPLIASSRPVAQKLGRGGRALVSIPLAAGVGYLIAFAAGYVLYQGYYGNLLAGRDGSVAAAISDWSLLGALAGAVWGWRRSKGGHSSEASINIPDWVLLWFVGFAALAVSGFGQGWFLRLGPQRLQILLWLPLCIMAAYGLHTMTPRWRRAFMVTLLCFGVTSVSVAAFCFQSPVGRRDAQGPWVDLHAEIMSKDDGGLLEALGGGVVMAPAPASDVVVLQRRNPVVFGIGTFNLTDQSYTELHGVVDTFFSPETSDQIRREIVQAWCVDWVYCPATWTVDAKTRAALSEAPWLELRQTAGEGAVYRVHLE